MLRRSENPRGQQAFDASVAFTVIATICVALRLYTRWFIVRSPGIEDHLIIVATVRDHRTLPTEYWTDDISVFLHRPGHLHRLPYVIYVVVY
jgi:hypothetical protein